MNSFADPYILIFLLPLGILLTICLIVFCAMENCKIQKEENSSTHVEQTVKWRSPKIVKIMQSTFGDTIPKKEHYLLVLKNIGKLRAEHVRIWDITKNREIKPKRKNMKFPPLDGCEIGISVNPQGTGEFILNNPPSEGGFWVEWREKDLKRNQKLYAGEQKTLSVLHNTL